MARVLLCVALLALFIASASAWSTGGCVKTSSGGNSNIRDSPCGNVVGSLRGGEVATITNGATTSKSCSGSTYSWIQIRASGASGYVASELLSSVSCSVSSTSSSSSGGDPTRLVSIPSINPRYSYCKQSTMLSIFGAGPCSLTSSCSTITNSKVSRQMLWSENVGPFKVSGLKPAVDALKRIFARVRTERPDLYESVETAGMSCCRAVRGSTSSWSNHSWGTAIDLQFNGKLDPVDDNKTQQGLLDLYPYFEAEKFYWGAGFSREDAMHFEASDQLMREWKAAGVV